jgi:hypothetical protein
MHKEYRFNEPHAEHTRSRQLTPHPKISHAETQKRKEISRKDKFKSLFLYTLCALGG